MDNFKSYDDFHVYCKACRRPINIEKGKYNMNQHNKTEKHINNAKIYTSSDLTAINLFEIIQVMKLK
jgi:hypothetical protein